MSVKWKLILDKQKSVNKTATEFTLFKSLVGKVQIKYKVE
jgi:hypothetical protein